MDAVIAYIAILCPRGNEDALRSAAKRLAVTPGITVQRWSSLFETRPVPPEPALRSIVATLSTRLAVEGLAATLGDVERASSSGAAAMLRIELLLYAEEIIATRVLVIPHRALHETAELLAPLVEVAPKAYHPTLARSAKGLLTQLVADGLDPGVIRRVEWAW